MAAEIWKHNNHGISLDLGLMKTLARKSRENRDVIVRKAASLKCFLSTLKGKAGVFKFLWFELIVFLKKL